MNNSNYKIVSYLKYKRIVDLVQNSNINIIYLLGENFSRITPESSKIKIFKTFKEFENFFTNNTLKGNAFLIKGSRGMALERVLKMID